MFRIITLLAVLLALVAEVLAANLRLLNLGGLSAYESLFFDPHFYAAFALTFVILIMNLLAWLQGYARFTMMAMSFVLLFLAATQTYLGIVALSMPELPVLTVFHVLIGVLNLAGVFWLFLRANPALVFQKQSNLLLTRLTVWVLLIELGLSVWLSLNHAELACTTFPLCSEDFPALSDYASLFNPQGVFGETEKLAIAWLHRTVSLICLTLLSIIAVLTALNNTKKIRYAGLSLIVLILADIALTIAGFQLAMPLWVSIARNAVSTLLLLPLISIAFYNRYTVPDVESVIEEQTLVIEQEQKPVTVTVEETKKPDYVEPPAESLYARLKSQLKRTRSGLSGVFANLTGQKSEDILEEIESTLLMADVGMDLTLSITGHLSKTLSKDEITQPDTLKAALKQELLNILKPCTAPLHIKKQDKPFVILVVGVNGAGKTTTIGKLAKRLQAQGLSVMLAAGDTFRAAAVEQLQVWGERNDITVIAQHTGADSASVIFDAVQSAHAKKIDVLIADTAGRLQNKANLMDELSKVKRIMSKLDDTAPHEVLLVLDAGTGQNALSQAKLFNEAVTLTGITLTKLDGTAKGGVIFALAKNTGIPIRFIGIGEGIDDLQDFDAERFVEALFVKD